MPSGFPPDGVRTVQPLRSHLGISPASEACVRGFSCSLFKSLSENLASTRVIRFLSHPNPYSGLLRLLHRRRPGEPAGGFFRVGIAASALLPEFTDAAHGRGQSARSSVAKAGDGGRVGRRDEVGDMRCPRWKAPPEHPAGYYHCVSRIVDRRFVLEVLERQKFRQFLGEYADFCGVRVLTWCVLSNHFHLLLEVPRKPTEPPPLEALIARLEFLSSAALSARAARQLVARWVAAGDTESPERLRRRFWAQMYDLSAFMKLLKQRFSQWFNRTHQRTGTLWEEVFHVPSFSALNSSIAWIFQVVTELRFTL